MQTPEVLSFREFRAGLAATFKQVQHGEPVFVGAHRKPEAVVMSVAHYRDLVELSWRREAVAEALASVRAEGLEPTPEALRLFGDLSAGSISSDTLREQILESYRR